MNDLQTNEYSNRPWPVTLLSILFGAGALLATWNLVQFLRLDMSIPRMGFLRTITVLQIGICAAITYGLWKLKNWGRILLIGFCGFQLVFIAYSLVPFVMRQGFPSAVSFYVWIGISLGILIGILYYMTRSAVRAHFR